MDSGRDAGLRLDEQTRMALLLGAIEETIEELAVRGDSALVEHFRRLQAMRLDLRERLGADAVGERRSA